MSDKILEAIKEQKALIETNFGTVDQKMSDLDTKVTDLDTRISEVETQNKKRKSEGLPGLEDEKKKFSISKAAYAIATHDWKHAGFEKEVFDEMEKKQMSTSAGSGGFFVPPQAITDVIELLNANAVVRNLGATVLGGLSGSPVTIPRQSSGSTAYWTAENASITASTIGDEQITLTPHAATALVKMSMRVAKLSDPSVEALVRNDIAVRLALLIDLACLKGSGVSNQPLGVANTASINTASFSSGSPTFKLMQDMVTELENDNALRGNLGYVMHPAVKNALKQERIAQYNGDTGGNYVVLPMSDAMLGDALGYKFAATTQLAQTEAFFGNWADLIIAEWGGFEMTASMETSTAFEKNQIWIRAIQEVDCGVRHPESFCYASDIVL